MLIHQIFDHSLFISQSNAMFLLVNEGLKPENTHTASQSAMICMVRLVSIPFSFHFASA